MMSAWRDLVWSGARHRPAAVQPMTVSAARGRRDRGDAAQVREGGLAPQPLGVIAQLLPLGVRQTFWQGLRAWP